MRLFVSYAREDRTDVDALVADLQHLGHDVWFDEQLLGGSDWWAEILSRIRAADVFVFALSPSSVSSIACLTELEYGNDTDRRLLPVMVRSTSLAALPAALVHAQYVDYSSTGSRDLAAALVRMPPSPPLPSPLPPEPTLPEPPLSSYWRRVISPEPMTRGEQHVMIADVRLESREPADAGVAYDVLVALGTRADLYADVSPSLRAALEATWSEVSPDDRASRVSPWADVPAWGWGYVIGICATAFVTLGLVPLIMGIRNRDRPRRRIQAWTMIVAGIAYLVVLVAFMIVGAISGESADQSSGSP
jgi:hypothetical protein